MPHPYPVIIVINYFAEARHAHAPVARKYIPLLKNVVIKDEIIIIIIITINNPFFLIINIQTSVYTHRSENDK